MNVINVAEPFAYHQCDKRFGRKHTFRRPAEIGHATEVSNDPGVEDSQSVDADVKSEPDSEKCIDMKIRI